MTTLETGTVSHGTLRPADLIPCFLQEARVRLTELDRCELALRRVDVEDVRKTLEQIDHAADKPDYYGSDAASFDLEWLFDTLDMLAPDGTVFEAHEGDGSDFGYWPLYED